MQRADHPRAISCILTGQPNVGALMSLCEENYARLVRLIPDLAARSGHAMSCIPDGPALYLEIEEQARFTTSVRLTYRFASAGQRHPDPDARLRVYHDARQIEVIDLRQRTLPVRGQNQSSALALKWQANLFIGKWLTYCLLQGHRFETGARARRSAVARAPICP
ncbi:hypothetical protein CKO25_16605 [Thiocapsa imhoffii]|uniref:DUF1249 domain-containing protein n=1 Tax=Thiocapsa imhoffii TaxID=382777 RepID=A0A9X0WKH4_9GAMM|nr:DUF1249 domain-containing protein [Thiocapsa imhoffii]MBK1646238.1 hypothetical protein [Thiocapsa imhoffii]